MRILSLLVWLSIAGCGADVATGDLPAIPEVETADFLPVAHEQLQRLRDEVERKPRNANAAGKLGMAYMAYQLYDASAAALTRARALQPRKWQWAYLHAIALTEIGDYAGAVTVLERVAARQPRQLMVRTRLGIACTRMGELEKAERVLSAVVDADPRLAEAVVGLARVLIRQDRPAEAIPHLERLLEVYGPSATTYFALAEAARRQGETDRSEEYFELFNRYRGVGLPSSDPVLSEVRRLDLSEKLLVREARRLIALGEVQKAVAVLHRALERNPGAVTVRASLIGAYGAMKQFDKVDEQYRLALQSGPPDARLLEALGKARVYENRFAEAQEALQRSIGLNPQNASAHAWLGIASRGQGRNAEAIEYFEAALAIDPNERTARLNIAELLLRQRQFDAAIEHLELLLAPESDATVTALYFLGQALASKGRFSEARVRFNEAIEVAGRRGNEQAVARVQALLAKLP